MCQPLVGTHALSTNEKYIQRDFQSLVVLTRAFSYVFVHPCTNAARRAGMLYSLECFYVSLPVVSNRYDLAAVSCAMYVFRPVSDQATLVFAQARRRTHLFSAHPVGARDIFSGLRSCIVRVCLQNSYIYPIYISCNIDMYVCATAVLAQLSCVAFTYFLMYVCRL